LHEETVYISSGSEVILGLSKGRCAVNSNLVYLLIGESCEKHCGFCSFSRRSTADKKMLSRVRWIPYPIKRITKQINRSFLKGKIKGCCIQTTKQSGNLEKTLKLCNHIDSRIGVSVSRDVEDIYEIKELFKNGVARVSVNLDAASSKLYENVKMGNFEKRIRLLEEASSLFPGKITSHLIAGLGERDDELIKTIQWMVENRITVALFAFTPIKGTIMEHSKQPSLTRYRKIQMALHLMKKGAISLDSIIFDGDGRITGFNIDKDILRDLLIDGSAFQTTGCPNCNRPFYNESVKGHWYNFPRRLRKDEVLQVLKNELEIY
jgi:biotin synthase